MAKLHPALGLSWLLALLVAPISAKAEEPAPIPLPPLAIAAAPTPPLAPPTLHLVATPVPLPLPAPRPITPRPMIWYGWETLAAGTGVYLLSLAVLKKDPESGLVLGSLLSPLTTMSMHMLHGDEVKGYLSLPLSYAIIAGGGVLAEKLECNRSSPAPCTANAVFTGMILGGLGAMVLDATVLAWGAPVLPEPVKKAVLWPSVTPLRGGAAVGLGGTF